MTEYSKLLISLVTQVLGAEKAPNMSAITITDVTETLDRIQLRLDPIEGTLDGLPYYELESSAKDAWREIVQERYAALTDLQNLVTVVNRSVGFTDETLKSAITKHGFKLVRS